MTRTPRLRTGMDDLIVARLGKISDRQLCLRAGVSHDALHRARLRGALRADALARLAAALSVPEDVLRLAIASAATEAGS